MKNTVVFSFGVAVCMMITAAAALMFRLPVSAKNAAGPAWEYASISGAYAASPVENPNVSFTSAVNICYLENDGCRFEQVTAGVAYNRFLQDNRLENGARAMELAKRRAVQNVYSSAITKLGRDGWEMVGRPDLQFDTFYQNSSGTFDVQEGNLSRKADIYFRRLK